MDAQQTRNILEACLLVAGKAMNIGQLENLFESDIDRPDRNEIRTALAELQAQYEGRGIELVEVASGWRLQSSASMEHWVSRLFQEKSPRYSRALLETLVLIAYRQPITRGEIEEVRGVAVSSNIIKTLQEREWVKEIGYKDVPGKPALWGTTRAFLDYFNLKRLDELPTLAEARELEEIEAALAVEGGIVGAANQSLAANDDLQSADGEQAPSEAGESEDAGSTDATGNTLAGLASGLPGAEISAVRSSGDENSEDELSGDEFSNVESAEVELSGTESTEAQRVAAGAAGTENVEAEIAGPENAGVDNTEGEIAGAENTEDEVVGAEANGVQVSTAEASKTGGELSELVNRFVEGEQSDNPGSESNYSEKVDGEVVDSEEIGQPSEVDSQVDEAIGTEDNFAAVAQGHVAVDAQVDSKADLTDQEVEENSDSNTESYDGSGDEAPDLDSQPDEHPDGEPQEENAVTDPAESAEAEQKPILSEELSADDIVVEEWKEPIPRPVSKPTGDSEEASVDLSVEDLDGPDTDEDASDNDERPGAEARLRRVIDDFAEEHKRDLEARPKLASRKDSNSESSRSDAELHESTSAQSNQIEREPALVEEVESNIHPSSSNARSHEQPQSSASAISSSSLFGLTGAVESEIVTDREIDHVDSTSNAEAEAEAEAEADVDVDVDGRDVSSADTDAEVDADGRTPAESHEGNNTEPDSSIALSAPDSDTKGAEP